MNVAGITKRLIIRTVILTSSICVSKVPTSVVDICLESEEYVRHVYFGAALLVLLLGGSFWPFMLSGFKLLYFYFFSFPFLSFLAFEVCIQL